MISAERDGANVQTGYSSTQEASLDGPSDSQSALGVYSVIAVSPCKLCGVSHSGVER